MKRIIVLLSALLVFAGCASQVTVNEEDRQYQEIVDFPGKNKDEIFDLISQSMSNVFVSAESVIDYENSESGKIIGKGVAEIIYTIAPTYTHYTLTVEVKDERVRFSFTDMYFPPSGVLGRMPLTNQGQIDSFSEHARKLVNEITEFCQDSNDNW